MIHDATLWLACTWQSNVWLSWIFLNLLSELNFWQSDYAIIAPPISLLSVWPGESLHCRNPSQQKPHRGVQQRPMASLAQNNKSLNCPGIFLEKKRKDNLHGYSIYNSLLSFISSSYITEALRNDSPEEGRVRNAIMSSVLGHVACQLYSYLQWSEMISESCSGHNNVNNNDYDVLCCSAFMCFRGEKNENQTHCSITN